MTQYSASVYTTTDAIKNDDWDSINANNTYFNKKFLKAFEISNPNISFRYIVIYNKSEAIGLVNLQIITLGIDVILKNIKLSKLAKKVVRLFLKKYPLKIMFCGNIFLSGEHGIYLRNNIDKKEAFLIISKTIKDLIRVSEYKPIHAVFIKDFYQKSLHITDNLMRFNYIKMPVEPNMVLKMNPRWKTFDDYKNDLKSKYRIKVNKAAIF